MPTPRRPRSRSGGRSPATSAAAAPTRTSSRRDCTQSSWQTRARKGRAMTAPRTDSKPNLAESSENLPAWGESARLAVVGMAHPRLEGVEKVTGRAQYTYDVRQPRQLYA